MKTFVLCGVPYSFLDCAQMHQEVCINANLAEDKNKIQVKIKGQIGRSVSVQKVHGIKSVQINEKVMLYNVKKTESGLV